MKKIKQLLSSIALGIFIVPYVMGMEPGHFHFQPQKKIPHRGKKNTLYDAPPKKAFSLANAKKSSRPIQESLKALLTPEPYENQDTENLVVHEINTLAKHKKQWDKTLEAARGEISHSQKKISQKALPQRASCYMSSALNNYFSKAFQTATEPQEKVLLSAYITTLQELIAIQERLNTALYDAGKITETTSAVAYLKSVSRYFAHRLRKINNPDKKSILSDCIVEIRTAINKRQFPHQPIILEHRKAKHLAPSMTSPNNTLKNKCAKNKILKVFIETTQTRVDEALLEAKKTNTVKPLQQLVTNLATLMLDANTNGDEQEILNDFINQLNDATHDSKFSQQQIGMLPPPGYSNDTVHFYRRRNQSTQHHIEPATNISVEQSIASTTAAPENSDSDQPSNAIMPEEEFKKLLEKVQTEYQISKSCNYLDDVLNGLRAKGVSRSPEAITLTYLKNNPHFLLYDTPAPKQATK